MSRSSGALVDGSDVETSSGRAPVSDPEGVLATPDDDDCRAILDATSDETLSASELSEACEVPLSTTYRKLDVLTDAGLLDERVRVRSSGRHEREYVRRVEDVLVSVARGGRLELRATRRETPGAFGSEDR